MSHDQPTPGLGGSADASSTTRRTRSTRRATSSRKAPPGAPELEHLPLHLLRSYRRELRDEEGRVSYWRRLVQARHDMALGSGRAGADTRLAERLGQALTDTGTSTRRQALLGVTPRDQVPPLPDIATLWATPFEPGDTQQREELLRRLAAAERELSDYRSALHRRIDAATAELIARYHADPAACLVALPLRPT